MRNQSDDDQEYWSNLSGLDTGTEGAARQEFYEDTLTQNILARYGAPAPPASQYGEVDYSIDLQTALRIREDARAAFQRLPASIRANFRNWEDLDEAIRAGRFTVVPEKAEDGPPDPAKTAA